MYDLTYSIHVTSYPVYDIICSMYENTKLCVVDNTLDICVTSFALQMLSHHSITSNHSIYDVTTTSGMTSYPLYQTSYPLYLCHYNLSTDIIPTFVLHHTLYMDDIICTLHNIISTTYVITLLCLCHHILYIWNHIQHVGPHIHYTCDILSSVWYHMLYVWKHKTVCGW